jgi:hypothetical protein
MRRVLLPLGVSLLLFGQTKPVIDPELVRFFSGAWACAGEFASGKKVEADLTFSPELDGTWLLYRHSDRPPGRFKSISMWGVDQASGRLISSAQDSSGGTRLFTSQGWKKDSVTFESAPILDRPPLKERFRYERQASDRFKMTYEVGSDDGHWKLGDYLVCKKRAAR